MNNIHIINNGGSFYLKSEPVNFLTTALLMASYDEGHENERLKDFLNDFDITVYIKAQESEANTTHRTNYFDRK